MEDLTTDYIVYIWEDSKDWQVIVNTNPREGRPEHASSGRFRSKEDAVGSFRLLVPGKGSFLVIEAPPGDFAKSALDDVMKSSNPRAEYRATMSSGLDSSSGVPWVSWILESLAGTDPQRSCRFVTVNAAEADVMLEAVLLLRGYELDRPPHGAGWRADGKGNSFCDVVKV